VVTLSTGEKTGDERFFRQEVKRLARAQRRHARKQKGSRNQEKARRKVARIADRRRDFQSKLTTRLIRPEPARSVSSRWPSRTCCKITAAACAISDVGWGELLRMLSYKASWYGRTFVSVNRWYPSSRRCSVCGHELDSLRARGPGVDLSHLWCGA
jgi:putative transposase